MKKEKCPDGSKDENVFQLKITLLETDPPIWRRIQVPESFMFYDLHVAIQNAMGWTDSHLHAFEIRWGRRLHQGIRIECPFAIEEIEEDDFLISTEVPLNGYLKKPGDQALYIYDFGDGWEHEVVLEGVFPKEPKIKYPTCLDGQLAGPPEDCGGIPGYYECVEAVKKRDNSDGLLTWLGSWNPHNFNPKRVEFENPRTRLKEILEG